MILLKVIALLGLTSYGYAENSDAKVLSRKKRFLIFPEGSSFQLVFCVTYPVITPIGDIFLWGNTAALAFELPQDPYSPFHHKADPQHRRVDNKHIYYTDEKGKILYKQPYERKLIVNPAFAKRSAINVDRKKMHLSSEKPGFHNMDSNQIDFHRSSRTQLYEKLEVMMDGMGGNGRACLLKILCMYRDSAHEPQGGFLHEILRLVYTLPKSRVENDLYQEYDQASSENCTESYPDCTFVDPIKSRTVVA